MSSTSYGAPKYGGYKRKRTYTPARRTYAPPGRLSIYGGAAKQLARDVMYLKTLINSEPHNFYVNTANNFNWAGYVVSLSDVPQGDGEGQRTGNRILPRFLNMNLHVVSAEGNTLIRVVLFRVQLLPVM